MKRHIVIATAAAAALIAGGAATAVAVNGNDGPGSPQSGAQTSAQLAAAGDVSGPAQGAAAGSGGSERSGGSAQDAGRSSIVLADRDDRQEDLREANAAKVSAAQAAAAALKAVPGTVTGLDLDNDEPGLVWDVDVLGKDGKWHDLTLDAGNGRVLNQHIDHDDDGDGDDHGQARVRDQLKGATTDAAAAARAGAAHGVVTSVDLDDDDRSAAVWEVETVTKDGKEHTFLVDPRSGKLTAAVAEDGDDD